MSNAIVIDVPMREMQTAIERAQERRCAYENIDGERCFRAVMEGKEVCSVHHYWELTSAGTMGLPFPQDAPSLQEFLAKMVNLTVSGELKKGRTAFLETLCRLLAENVRLMGR